MGCAGHEQCVAIGLCLCDGLGGYIAAPARLVFNDLLFPVMIIALILSSISLVPFVETFRQEASGHCYTAFGAASSSCEYFRGLA